MQKVLQFTQFNWLAGGYIIGNYFISRAVLVFIYRNYRFFNAGIAGYDFADSVGVHLNGIHLLHTPS
jgi:hypothetical protein